jgi:hypothetical protein
MARGGKPTVLRRRWVWQSTAIVAMVAVIAGVAIVAEGFNVQEVPVNSSSVWVMQNGEGQRYGQVNTSIKELDGAYPVDQPTVLVQSTSDLFVYAEGNSSFAPVNPGQPTDLFENKSSFVKTPAQTVDVASGGGVVAYLGGDGTVAVSIVTSGQKLSDPVQVAASAAGPSTAESAVAFRAVAVSLAGLVYLYSPNDNGKQSIRTFDPAKGALSGPTDVTTGPESSSGLQLSTVGDKWILLDQDTRQVWTPGQSPATLAQNLGANPELQVPGPNRDLAYLATESGLVSVALAGDPLPTLTFEATGTPTRPRDFKDHMYAAWLPVAGTSGVLYDATDDESITLDFNEETLPADVVAPIFQANENAMVLNESATGWTWTIPDGELIPSSQDWSLTDLTPDRTSDQAEVTDVTSPKKPVAEPDVFGVRPGQLVTLPVLLNDYDANNDLLTVIPSSVGGLDGAFGSVAVASNSQTLVISVPAGASGQTSLSYAVTDGTSVDGLNSDPTSVQIIVIPLDTNSAPAWCGDLPTGCVQKWPNVQVASQGSVTVPFLAGWVDPEGDQFFVESVLNESGLGQAGVSPDGTISFRAPNVTEVTTVNLKVRVTDVQGASTDRTLAITVSPEPTLTLTPFVVTTSVGERVTVDVAPHLSGYSEAPTISQLETTTPTQDVELATTAPTEFTFVSQAAGDYYVSLTVTSKNASVTSKVRVSVIPAESAGVTTSPVSVYLTPNADTVIDVLSATMNPTGRALLTTNIELRPVDDPQAGRATLFADPIDQGHIRVRGSTGNGLPGLIGRVTYTVSDGSGEARYTAVGEASVYLLPEPASQPPVGVDDQVVVRAGGQVDVAVLANDAGPAGAVLDLAPASVDCGEAEGEIVFASNNQMRVLAPTVAGTVTCSYSVFVRGNSLVTAQAKLVITVKDASSNRAPQPPTLTGQVLAGGSVSIPLEFSQMDPDGDRVTLVNLEKPSPGGYATLSSDRSAIVYTSLSDAQGQATFTYTVKDSQDVEGTGTVRIAITSDEPDPGPVTLSDYVEVPTGSEARAIISPTGNDFDPLREGLTIVDVKPNRGSEEDPLYKEWKSRIVEATETQITFSGTADPSTMEFVYTVQDADGNVATGTIVVKVTDSGAATYPVVADTFLSFEQISQLPSGIDVLTERVSWSSGNAANLTLSVERSTGSYSVSGSKIVGNAPVDGDLVTFKVQGTDSAGLEVVSYGFMHVPSQKDALLSLDPNTARQSVNEDETKTWNLAELLSLPAGMNVEVDANSIESLGDREEGKCTSAGGTSFSYSAGKGKPYEDGCVVPARLVGSDSYTDLLVPITVIPVNPPPELASRKLTISPGKLGTQEFDLRNMTTWPGKTQADIDALVYEYSYSGDDFEITQQNQILTITAKAQSSSGTKAEVIVSIPQFANDTDPAPLVLVVGEQLNGGPVGGSITKVCQANSGSCSIPKSEMRGAYDPWSPGTNPNFAPFGYRGGSPEYDREDNVMMCGSVRLTATADSIEATWNAGAAAQGVNCPNITYLVLDQNEQNGSGTLNFTLEGPPAAPGAVRQSGYTENSLTLTISPGQAGQAAPRLEAYVVYMDGNRELECTVPEGRESVDRECEINGLTAYDGTNEADNHTFRVTAKNSIGESASAATLSNAYAYRAPLAITSDIVESAETIFDPAITTDSRGAVKMTINPIADSLVTQYKIQGEGQAATLYPVDGSTFTVNNVAAAVGERSNIVITALGRVPPPTSGGQDSSTTWNVRVAGSPTIGSLVVQGTPVQSSGADTFEAELALSVSSRNYSLNTGSYVVALWPSGSTEPTCVDQINNLADSRAPAPVAVNASPSTIASAATLEGSDQDSVRSWTANVRLEGLASQQSYNSKVCYSNAFGTKSLAGSVVSTLADPDEGDFTYAVNRSADNSGPSGLAWYAKIVSQPSIPAGLRAEFTADPPSSGASRTWWQNNLQDPTFGNANPTYYVRYCATTGASCSPGAMTVGFADSQRMQQMKITGATLAAGQTCTYDFGLQFEAQGSGLSANGAAAWRVTPTDPPPTVVPAEYSIDGGASFAPMVKSGRFWAVPDDPSLSDVASVVIRVYLQGNPSGSGPTAGLTGVQAVTLSPVTCNREL